MCDRSWAARVGGEVVVTVEDIHYKAGEGTLEVVLHGHLTECAEKAIEIGQAILGQHRWCVTRFAYIGNPARDSISSARVEMVVKEGGFGG
jgi:hypothetical protein